MAMALSLPAELWYHIGGFLTPSDISSLTKACKDLNRMMSSPYLWHKKLLQLWAEEPDLPPDKRQSTCLRREALCRYLQAGLWVEDPSLRQPQLEAEIAHLLWLQDPKSIQRLNATDWQVKFLESHRMLEDDQVAAMFLHQILANRIFGGSPELTQNQLKAGLKPKRSVGNFLPEQALLRWAPLVVTLALKTGTFVPSPYLAKIRPAVDNLEGLLSGTWAKFYIYSNLQVDSKSSMTLRYAGDGKFFGVGQDGVGTFSLYGTVNTRTWIVTFTKRYPTFHWTYNGCLSSFGICGCWGRRFP